MLLSKSKKYGLLRILNDLECWTRKKEGLGGRRYKEEGAQGGIGDGEEGGTGRKEGQGGRRDWGEGGTMREKI